MCANNTKDKINWGTWQNLLKSPHKKLSLNTETPYNIWQIVPSIIFISSVNKGSSVISIQEVYLILLVKFPNNVKPKIPLLGKNFTTES